MSLSMHLSQSKQITFPNKALNEKNIWQNLKIHIILLCDVTAGYQNKENVVSALPQNREVGNNKLIYGNYTLSKQIKHWLGH